MQQAITTLFLDIGGVLLTNGWGRSSRKLAAVQFKIDLVEMDERHHLTFDTYEMGRINLDEYLHRTVFYEERDFSPAEFKTFMYSQSQPIPGSIEYFKSLKAKHRLKVIAVNNEGRELNDYRIKQFGLTQLFDAFVSSCYVELRKPDAGIFNLAVDIAGASPTNSIMIDDRPMFVSVASSTGIKGLHFDSLDGIKEKISKINFHS